MKLIENGFVRPRHEVEPPNERDGWADDVTIFGHAAEQGTKHPPSWVKRTVIVKCDGNGGRTPIVQAVKRFTVTDEIRALIAAGASSVVEIKRRWMRLVKKRAITAAWADDCEQIARKLLRVR